MKHRLDRVSAGAAALALLWVVAAVLALFFVPVITSESSTSETGSTAVVTTRETYPVIRSNGSVKAGAVAIGVLVLAVGWRLGRPPRSALLAMSYLTAAFCVITGFSIGVFFLPVPLLLVVAGLTSQPRAPRGLAPSLVER